MIFMKMSIKLIENNEVIIVFQPASLPVNKREQTKVIDRESNRNARWIKQAISIRQTTPIMNRDEGEYRLSHVWDDLLAMPTMVQKN